MALEHSVLTEAGHQRPTLADSTYMSTRSRATSRDKKRTGGRKEEGNGMGFLLAGDNVLKCPVMMVAHTCEYSEIMSFKLVNCVVCEL